MMTAQIVKIQLQTYEKTVECNTKAKFIFRFAVEFVRIPDSHIGYLSGDWLTMGHVLTTPMIIGGAALMFLAYRRRT